MRRSFKLLSVVGAGMLLTSCSPAQIEIAVERVGGRVRLSFSQDSGFIGRDRAPCIRTISIHEPDVYENAKAAWVIEAMGGVQCLDLRSVTVGEVPAGWQEVVPFTAVSGQTYEIEASGIGSGRRIAKI